MENARAYTSVCHNLDNSGEALGEPVQILGEQAAFLGLKASASRSKRRRASAVSFSCCPLCAWKSSPRTRPADTRGPLANARGEGVGLRLERLRLGRLPRRAGIWRCPVKEIRRVFEA